MFLSEIRDFRDDAFKDKRGIYWTSWKKDKIVGLEFNHDKFSLSKKNVLRGFHGDRKSYKLVSCVYGEVLFVLINAQRDHKEYLKYRSWRLTGENRMQVLIPPNFASAHFCVTDKCLFHYKFSYKGNYPDVKDQFSYKWNDKKINFKWPTDKPILSERDK